MILPLRLECGERGSLGSYGPYPGETVSLALWPTTNPEADKPDRVVTLETESGSLAGEHFSPNGRWAEFCRYDRRISPVPLEIGVTPADTSLPERVDPDRSRSPLGRTNRDGRPMAGLSISSHAIRRRTSTSGASDSSPNAARRLASPSRSPTFDTSEAWSSRQISPDRRWTFRRVIAVLTMKTVERQHLDARQRGSVRRSASYGACQSVFLPSGWTADGRAILGSYLSPIYTGPSVLALWSSSIPASAPARVLIADPRSQLWQGRFSPDGRWLSFVATSREGPQSTKLVVAPAAGAPAADWTRIALEHEWADKPRWAPDGRMLYFLSRHQTSFYNLWGIRFDPVRGKPVGEPFMVTRLDSPGLVISPLIGDSEIGISARRAMLTMATVSGNIWMLDGSGPSATADGPSAFASCAATARTGLPRSTPAVGL